MSAARAAAVSGAAAVLACGGDGTVNAVLEGVVGTDAALGVVPGGSGDDIAMSLGYPLDDAHAMAGLVLSSLRSGSRRGVDVGHVTTADGTARHFLGVMSTGFDSAVNERANTMPRLAGQRYNVAIMRELASFRAVPYELGVDDELVLGQAMLVAVGNGSTYGGGMRVCPDAVTDDGLLDVTWVGAVSKPTFLKVLPTVFSGRHVLHPAVRTFRGRRLAISAPGQIAYADGERVGPLPVVVETRVDALRVLSG